MPKRTNGKISDALLRRLQLQRGLRRLSDESLDVEAWQAIAKHLAELLTQGIPFPWLVDIVQQSQHTQLTASLLAHLLISSDNPDLAEQVAEHIGSRALPDAAKAEFLKVLFYYGYDLTDLSSDFFDDPTLMVQASVDSMLKQLEHEPDAVGYILEELQQLHEEDKLSYVQDLVKTKDSRCLTLLYHLAFSDNKQIAHAAITGLAAMRNGRALGALQSLQSEISDGKLQSLLDREARRLQFMALEPEIPTTQTPAVLSDSLVGAPDTHGQQAIWLVGKEGTACVVVQVVTDLLEGVVDAYGVGGLNEESYQQFLVDTEERHTLLMGANEYALALLQNALAINRTSDMLLPDACYYWCRRLRLTLEPATYLPEVTSYRRELSLEAIIQMPVIREWSLENPLVAKLAKDLEKALADKFAFSTRLHDCFKQLAEKLVDPVKHKWIGRLRHAADYYHKLRDQEVAAALAQAVHDLEVRKTCLDNTFFQALFLQSMLQAFH